MSVCIRLYSGDEIIFNHVKDILDLMNRIEQIITIMNKAKLVFSIDKIYRIGDSNNE